MAKSKFSHSSQYLAFSSPDGRLKLWDSDTGILKQQYTPSSHLSATLSCISWASCGKHLEKSPKKKKKKKHGVHHDSQNLIALGTVVGKILIYDVSTADLKTQLDGEHASRINDVCWDINAKSLYSCSNDAHIIQWSLEDGIIKCKWKSENDASISAVLLMDQDNLLSSSHSIIWWNLQTKEIVKKFAGHKNEVNILTPIIFSESDDHSYFLSSAENDKIVNIWKMDSKDENKLALGVLSVNEVVSNLSIYNQPTKSEPVIVAVVTKSGILKIFTHQLNGMCKKPLKSTYSILIASEVEQNSHSVPIPILNAKIISSEEVLIVHGNFLQPTFERIKLADCASHTCLVRKHPGFETSLNITNTKIRMPDTKKNAKVLVPGHMNPAYPQEEVDNVNKKRKNASISLSEVTIEERLNDIRTRRNSENVPSNDNIPSTDNMMHLLIQGLQSTDQKMLNSVLQKSNEVEIRNTVRLLPNQYILPLINELTKRIHGKSQSNHSYVKWLLSVLTNHTAYFMMHHDVSQLLRPLNELLNSKLELFHRLSKLSGKLELILSQVSSKHLEPKLNISTEPLLLYEEDSPEEDDDFMRPNHSESEDNWDDLSDLENMDKSDDEDSVMDTVEGLNENSEDEIDMT
ncbi:WD repeat-containing protein 43 [Nymphon striatum]|nr:WD repeat-containing protein 43 [Nymphon striatum]